MHKRRAYLWVAGTLLCVIFAVSLLAAHAGTVSDMTQSVQPHILPLTRGDYGGPAWLTSDQIALYYQPSFSAGAWTGRIILYSVHTNDVRQLPVPSEPPDCPNRWIDGALARLPNGNLGFIVSCNASIGPDILYMWTRQSDGSEILQKYPDHMPAALFAYSPDMSALVQESAVGAGMENQLFWVTDQGKMDRLVPTFQRASSPTWSPDGRTIAFFGTDLYSGGNPDSFTTFGQIESLVLYPWDVYLMDAATRKVKVVLPQVEDTGALKWSPDGRFLAFSGTYSTLPGIRLPWTRRTGIWLYQVSTSQLIRVWPELATFDWSPDGHQMVVTMWESGNGGDNEIAQYSSVAIIDLPISAP